MIAALLPLASNVVGTLTGAAPALPSAASATAGADFSAALAQAAGNGVNSLKAAESASMAGIQGKVSVQNVVEHVMEAERTLQTSLAIRDKAVAAYQQISQMAI